MTEDPEREERRMEALRDAVDRCHADNRHPSAIIGALLVAISDSQEVTNLAVSLLDSMVFSGDV
jgi:hypothetical protein